MMKRRVLIFVLALALALLSACGGRSAPASGGSSRSSAAPVSASADGGNEERYEGDLVGGKREGYGICWYANGDRYEGQWENDMRSGEGVYYYADGRRWAGEFREDERYDGTLYAAGEDPEEEPALQEMDYDDVEMDRDMLQAVVDGKKMTFYLQKKGSAFDGYEFNYISFTPQGEANYSIYLRMPLRRSNAGSYGMDWSQACYFSVSTHYKGGGSWGDTYRMVHYESPHNADHIGSFSLTLDQDISWDTPEGTGSFTAELVGYTGAAVGNTMSITDGRFHFTNGMTHPYVEAWQQSSDGSINGTPTVDPNGALPAEGKTTCPKCGGSGQLLCGICDGTGYFLTQKTGTDYGNGGKTYTVKEDCKACTNGFYTCTRCNGRGKV